MVLYAFFLFRFIPLDGLFSGDIGAKQIQITALIYNRFSSLALPYPGASFDRLTQFSPLPALFTWKIGVNFYSIFSYPHAALMAIPFFLCGYAGLYVIPLLATSFSLLAGAYISRRIIPGMQLFTLLLLALATPLSFYGLVPWEHALATCLTTWSTLFVIRAYEHSHWIDGLLGGLCAACATWMRIETIWFIPAIIIGTVVSSGINRSILTALTLGLLIGLVPFVTFNFYVFGLPLGGQVAVNFGRPAIGSTTDFIWLRFKITQAMLLDRNIPVFLPLLEISLLVIARYVSKTWKLICIFGCAVLEFLSLTSIPALADRTGLLGTCPLILGIVLLDIGKIRQIERLFLVISGIYVLGVIISSPNDGGAQWGPRYLLPILPLLVFLSIRSVQIILKKQPAIRTGLIIVAGLFACYSFYLQLLGLQRLRTSMIDNIQLVKATSGQQEQIVLTDEWFIPQILAQLYYNHTILYITHPEDLSAVRRLLKQHQVSGITYVTKQGWGKNPQTQKDAGLACTYIQRAMLDLNVLHCKLE